MYLLSSLRSPFVFIDFSALSLRTQANGYGFLGSFSFTVHFSFLKPHYYKLWLSVLFVRYFAIES